jgi:beta-glucosidase
LSTQYRFACAEDPLPNYPLSLVACDEHRALALEAAEKSAVLLENNGVLPFERAAVRKLAVLGRLAAMENTGDFGSSRVRPPYVVTALAGLQLLLGAEAILTGDEADLDAARAAASGADAVVVVVGNTADDEGEYIPGDISLGQGESQASEEAVAAQNMIGGGKPSRGGDRADLGLAADQVALIEAAVGTGKPVVVVIVAGSAVTVEEWRKGASAILQTFYAGMEGGTALARLLFGDVSPSGRLPFTVATDAAHYPFFDRDADRIDYDYWHGYAKLEKDGVEPRYPFGHGLSYARFVHRALTVRRIDERLEVSVAIRNDGAVAAADVVQCYLGCPGEVEPRWPKSLKAFARVYLRPGETRLVRMVIALDDLRHRDGRAHGWRLESGTYRVLVARSAADREPLVTEMRL